MHVGDSSSSVCKTLLIITLVVFDVRVGLHITFQFNMDITGISHVNGVSGPQKNFDSLECEGVMQVIDRDHNSYALNEKERNENCQQLLALECIYEHVSWLYKYLTNVSEHVWKLANEVQEDCLQSKKFYVPLRFIELFRFYTRHKYSIVTYFKQHCTCGFFHARVDAKGMLYKQCICNSNMAFNRKLIALIIKHK